MLSTKNRGYCGVAASRVDGRRRRKFCQEWRTWYLASGLWRDPTTGVYFGSSEPRKDALALGY
jgi:hypothetical protein